MDIESIHQAELLVRQANQALADAGVGITATQLAALAFIAEKPVGRTHGEIARYLGVTPAAVTGLVGRFERNKLVIRISSNGDYDRRIVYAQIREAGRIVLDNAQQAFADFAAEEGQVSA